MCWSLSLSLPWLPHGQFRPRSSLRPLLSSRLPELSSQQAQASPFGGESPHSGWHRLLPSSGESLRVGPPSPQTEASVVQLGPVLQDSILRGGGEATASLAHGSRMRGSQPGTPPSSPQSCPALAQFGEWLACWGPLSWLFLLDGLVASHC